MLRLCWLRIWLVACLGTLVRIVVVVVRAFVAIESVFSVGSSSTRASHFATRLADPALGARDRSTGRLGYGSGGLAAPQTHPFGGELAP